MLAFHMRASEEPWMVVGCWVAKAACAAWVFFPPAIWQFHQRAERI